MTYISFVHLEKSFNTKFYNLEGEKDLARCEQTQTIIKSL